MHAAIQQYLLVASQSRNSCKSQYRRQSECCYQCDSALPYQFGIVSRISPSNIQRFLAGAYEILDSAADFWESWGPNRKPLACVMGSRMHQLAVMFEKYVDEGSPSRRPFEGESGFDWQYAYSSARKFELNNANDWVAKLPKVSSCLRFIMLSQGMQSMRS